MSGNQYSTMKLHGRWFHLGCATRTELNHIDGFMVLDKNIKPKKACDTCGGLLIEPPRPEEK